MSLSATRELIYALSRDPAIEHAVKSRLLAGEAAVLQQQYDAICQESDQALRDAESETLENRGMSQSSIFGQAQSPFLPRIMRFLHFSNAKDGATFAWKVLVHVADNAMYELDGGEAKVQEGEDENDFLHEDIDKLMLQACKIIGAGSAGRAMRGLGCIEG